MPADLDKLQGTWMVTSFETDGQAMPAAAFAGAKIVIAKSTFRSVGMGATYKGTVALDPKKQPKTFDLVFSDGPEKGNRNLGIYTLEGDTWTICLATRGDTRPKAFDTRSGTGFALETLEREGAGRKIPQSKSQAKAAAPVEEERTGVETELEGEWAMLSGVFSGKPLDKNHVKWCKRVTRGDVTSVIAGPQVMLKARFTLDSSKTPHAIEYVNLEGPAAGKPQAGIFALRGDTLEICMGAPGKPRPADFRSESGDGRSYTTWRRETY
jgi:uncharacterized protein (TIGR03067 family)